MIVTTGYRQKTCQTISQKWEILFYYLISKRLVVSDNWNNRHCAMSAFRPVGIQARAPFLSPPVQCSSSTACPVQHGPAAAAAHGIQHPAPSVCVQALGTACVRVGPANAAKRLVN